MKYSVNKKQCFLGAFYALLATMFFYSDAAFAATEGKSLADMSKHLGSQFNSTAELMRNFAGLAGFAFVIGGIFAIMNAKKQQQPLGAGIAVMFAGIILMSVVAFTNMGARTVLGEDSDAISNLGLQ